MTARKSSREGSRRGWMDPAFFAILGVISATYVLLIVAMLGADAIYLFTAKRDVPVAVEFDVDANGKMLTGDADLQSAFAAYGMTFSLEQAADKRLAVLDSARVTWPQRALGTPNEDFGGPGVGDGGQRNSPHANSLSLSRVLVVADAEAGRPRYECRFDFAAAARIRRIHWSRPLSAPIHILRIPAGGEEPRPSDHPPGAQEAPGGADPVRRVVLWSEESFGEATVDYELLSQAAASARQPARRSVAAMSILVAGAENAKVVLADRASRLRIQWQEPVTVDQLTLLNATQPVPVELERIADAPAWRRAVEPTGVNGVRREVFEVGQVRAMSVTLPAGAALAGIRFRWAGALKGEWERRHPTLAKFTNNTMVAALRKKEIRYSIKLSLISCTMTTIISLWIAVPVGYLLSRYRFPFHNFIDAVLDIPIVLPPLVVGLSLLILFQFFPAWIQERVVYEIPAVILAQVSVACAFAVRSMRASFDLIDRRREQVALTLGCTRAQAFFYVVLPEAGRGMLTAGTLAWARALGEFGPLLIFAGATRMKTEVLSTTVFLELSVGDLGAAVAVSLIMVASAIIVLVLARMWGSRALSI